MTDRPLPEHIEIETAMAGVHWTSTDLYTAIGPGGDGRILERPVPSTVVRIPTLIAPARTPPIMARFESPTTTIHPSMQAWHRGAEAALLGRTDCLVFNTIWKSVMAGDVFMLRWAGADGPGFLSVAVADFNLPSPDHPDRGDNPLSSQTVRVR